MKPPGRGGGNVRGGRDHAELQTRLQPHPGCGHLRQPPRIFRVPSVPPGPRLPGLPRQQRAEAQRRRAEVLYRGGDGDIHHDGHPAKWRHLQPVRASVDL